MANTKISDLTAGAAVSATDVLPNVQTTGVGPVKTTAAELKTFMSASPTLVTPNLGTPSAGTLTSCTGLPISTGVSGLGTGNATALAVNVGSAGAFVRNNAAETVSGALTLTSATPQLTLGVNATTLGSIKLFGNTSGDVTLKVAAAAGTATVFQLPASNGTSGYFLQTDGNGVTSWAAGGGGVTINSTAITSGTASRVLFENSSNQVSEDAGLTFNSTTKALAIGGATVTTSAPALNVTQTWNGTSGDMFYGAVVNITTTPNTTSSYSSPLFAVQIGGKNVMHVGAVGSADNSYATLNLGGINYTPSFTSSTLSDNGTTLNIGSGRTTINLNASTTAAIGNDATAFRVNNSASIGFSSSTADTASTTTLRRIADGIVSVRGSSTTTPGAFNFYTYGASPPSAPSASMALLYADTSGGKIRLMALFPSGVAQQIAIEP
jgi:hypothetical protein